MWIDNAGNAPTLLALHRGHDPDRWLELTYTDDAVITQVDEGRPAGLMTGLSPRPPHHIPYSCHHGRADTVALVIDIVDQMMCRGLLTEVPTAQPWPPSPVTFSTASWGTVEREACLPRLPPTPPRWRIRGALALLTTLAVREAGRSVSCFARVLALLRFATRYGRPAGDEQALFAVNGVRHAARFFPARIACLEESVAAMLSLTLAGYRACWCHGVAADPLRLHAWVEANGKRVGEPASAELFTPIMRIPSGGDDTARRPM